MELSKMVQNSRLLIFTFIRIICACIGNANCLINYRPRLHWKDMYFKTICDVNRTYFSMNFETII